MFEHFDDPWPLDDHLADVRGVRRRGRQLRVRRLFTQAGVGAVAMMSVAGAATLTHTNTPRRETVVLAAGAPASGSTTLPAPGTPGSPTTTAPADSVSTSDDLTVAGGAGTADPAEPDARPIDEPGAANPSAPAPGGATPGAAPPAGADDEPPASTPPSAGTQPIVVVAGVDATLEPAAKNANNGAGRSLRAQNPAASIVGFDLRGIDLAGAARATLRLTVCHTPGDPGFCPDAPHDWPAAGGHVTASRLNSGWERWATFAGNGNNFPIAGNPRGTGSGVTWNCVSDTDIANEARDCSGADAWEAGTAVQGPGRDSGLVGNGLANGTVVEFDVSADVVLGLGSDSTYLSFFVRKLAQTGGGSATFYSVEGAAAAGNAAFAPQIVITY